HRRAAAAARVSPGEFLERDRIAYGLEAGPSVFLRHEDAEEPELAHLLRPRLRELLALVEGAGLRDDLLLRERPHRFARDLLGFGGREIHVRQRTPFVRINSPRPNLDDPPGTRGWGVAATRATAAHGGPGRVPGRPAPGHAPSGRATRQPLAPAAGAD